MNIKNIFQVSALASALVLAGCGGDIKIQPTVNNVNSNNTTGGPVSETNPCASYDLGGTTIQGEFTSAGDCKYDTSFANADVSITDDITFTKLTAGGVHVFDAMLVIGEDCDTSANCDINSIPTPTMTVQAGATIAFTSGEAVLHIARGAKLNAIGTLDNPVTFTSANAFTHLDSVGNGPLYADWGGIMITGFGITTQCNQAARDADNCNAKTEGTVVNYGGDNNADNSGTLKYVNIWYAGSGPIDGGNGNDLNSLTLAGVGSGTTIDYVHIHQGYDDGIEFFGGAVDISHIVVTDTQDDSIDIDEGWQGRGQFIIAKHGVVAGESMGNNGFETDGIKGTEEGVALASNPTISNVTVITTDGTSVRDNKASRAFTFDDSIKSSYNNVLIVETATKTQSCINHTADGDKNADAIFFNNSAMACTENFDAINFASGPNAGTAKLTWFEGSTSSAQLPANAALLVDGFATDIDAPALATAGVDALDPTTLNGLSGTFFKEAEYVGAVSDQDTTSSWYKWAKAAVEASSLDD